MYFYLFIIILLLYASLYYLHNNEISIYQVNIKNFDFDLLYKKQPIVISEQITDIDTIVGNWFNFNIIYNMIKDMMLYMICKQYNLDMI